MTSKNSFASMSKTLLAGAALSALTAAGAAAQSSSDEIIVTATKRAQTLQEVPIAVSVVGADTVEKAQIQDLFDLQASVPSLRISQLQNSSQTNFIIRGFGNGANNPGIESSVGVFIDGVYRSRSAAALLDLPVLDRVEILRGPQSTLFGKNVSAGAISITTQAPRYEWGGNLEATYGEFNEAILRGTVTGPINDKTAFRLSGSFNRRDGFYTNSIDGTEVNERDRWAVRGQLLFEPTDVLSFKLIGDYNKIDEVCCGAIQLLNAAPTLAVAAPPPLGLGRAIDPDGDNDYNIAFDQNPINTLEGYGGSLQADWDVDFATVTSITAYREQTDNSNTDADFTGAAIGVNPQSRKYETFTQEIRIASNGSNFVDWLVGGFFFDEAVESTRDVVFGSEARAFFDLLAFSPDLGGSALDAIEAATMTPAGSFFADGSGHFGAYEMDNRSFSLFGQVDINLTDRLTVTGGVSYIDDRKEYTTNEVLTEGFSIAGRDTLVGVGNGLLFQGAFAQGLADAGVDPTDDAAVAAFATAQPAIFAAIQGGAQAFADANQENPTVNPLLPLQALQLFAVPVNVPDPSNPLDDGIRQDDKVTYTARVAYDVTDFLNAYFTYATGWKAAAVNLSSDTRPPDPVTGFGREANPEDVTLYEIGIKAAFDRGFINIALFDQTIEDFQSNLFIGTAFVLANAEEQSVRGFEIDSQYQPWDPLVVSFGLTYLDPEFDSFQSAPCTSFVGFEVPACDVPGATTFDASGLTPAGISPWSISTAATYTHDFANGTQGYLRTEYQYESETQVVDNVSPAIASRTVNMLNISAGLAFENGFEVMGWVRNALDDQYLVSAFPTVAQPGSFSGYLNEPRTFGATVRKSF